ncbi:MAG: hypothetical protein LBS25_02050, partial [Candidatus Symbiothrix sp.]|nr:hypothetical protein [Candidatus Symbiothrix sp.]
NKNENLIGTKKFYSYDDTKFINDWIIETRTKSKGYENLAFMGCYGNDFLNQNIIRIMRTKEEFAAPRGSYITQGNLIECCIYFAVRKVIPASWLNDRDQFLYPNKKWKKDLEFQNDCLAYTLFSNNIQSKFGMNKWIPFTEYQVGARDKFDSNFMTDFMAGKLPKENIVSEPMLFYKYGDGDSFGDYVPEKPKTIVREFSETAKDVFRAGRELWEYYQQQPNVNVNASLYDIREWFQGRNDKGKMNNKSDNEKYNRMLGKLRETLKVLAQKIEPKVYESGFLMK